MHIHTTVSSLRQALSTSQHIAFAPTMGNLHEGHISLMQQARQYGQQVVSSIFVNRTQFGPNEDFDKYPRTFTEDCSKLEAARVDHLFAPEEHELYPKPQQYFVLPSLAHDSILEGGSRPGHFRGMATVVAKLFNIVRPNTALFGKKDYQQLMIIRNMVHELNMPIEIVGCETIRATDGLALSSRNGYLSAIERQEAVRLSSELNKIKQAVNNTSESHWATLENHAIGQLATHGWEVDYIAVRCQSDLQPPRKNEALVVLGAARLGKTRLIDNMEIF